MTKQKNNTTMGIDIAKKGAEQHIESFHFLLREMKFRAWNVDTNSFVKPKDLNHPDRMSVILTDRGFAFPKNAFIYTQYIGELDKHKKEIYEGDIVRFRSSLNYFLNIMFSDRKKGNPPKYINSVVEFNNGIFYFNGMYGYEGKEIDWKQVEVIGNIFKNKNLLKTILK